MTTGWASDSLHRITSRLLTMAAFLSSSKSTAGKPCVRGLRAHTRRALSVSESSLRPSSLGVLARISERMLGPPDPTSRSLSANCLVSTAGSPGVGLRLFVPCRPTTRHSSPAGSPSGMRGSGWVPAPDVPADCSRSSCGSWPISVLVYRSCSLSLRTSAC